MWEKSSKSVTRITIVCSLAMSFIIHNRLIVLSLFQALYDRRIVSFRHFGEVPVQEWLFILLFVKLILDFWSDAARHLKESIIHWSCQIRKQSTFYGVIQGIFNLGWGFFTGSTLEHVHELTRFNINCCRSHLSNNLWGRCRNLWSSHWLRSLCSFRFFLFWSTTLFWLWSVYFCTWRGSCLYRSEYIVLTKGAALPFWLGAFSLIFQLN